MPADARQRLRYQYLISFMGQIGGCAHPADTGADHEYINLFAAHVTVPVQIP